MGGKTHGLSHMPEYRIWKGMLARCHNSKSPNWEDYGGRGIKVLFASFEEFFAEIGPRPSPDLSVDRIDNDGNYESGNIRWAIRSQQAKNKRTSKEPRCPACGEQFLKWGWRILCNKCAKKVRHIGVRRSSDPSTLSIAQKK